MKPKHDLVAEFFDEYPDPVPDLARRLRALILSELPDASEDLDRPGRVVGYSYGPGYAGLVCTIILSKAGVKLGVVGSGDMPDPANLLEGAGRRHRYIAFGQTSDFARPGIRDLLRTAARRWKDGQKEKV